MHIFNGVRKFSVPVFINVAYSMRNVSVRIIMVHKCVVNVASSAQVPRLEVEPNIVHVRRVPDVHWRSNMLKCFWDRQWKFFSFENSHFSFKETIFY